MKTLFSTVLGLCFLGVFSVSAYSAEAPLDMSGSVVVDTQGKTVYTFDKDVVNSGKSACNDACADAWPPVIAGADAAPSGDLTIVTREDGSKQWAYKGKPLYYFAKDTEAGDKKGDKVRDIWHVVSP